MKIGYVFIAMVILGCQGNYDTDLYASNGTECIPIIYDVDSGLDFNYCETYISYTIYDGGVECVSVPLDGGEIDTVCNYNASCLILKNCCNTLETTEANYCNSIANKNNTSDCNSELIYFKDNCGV